MKCLNFTFSSSFLKKENLRLCLGLDFETSEKKNNRRGKGQDRKRLV